MKTLKNLLIFIALLIGSVSCDGQMVPGIGQFICPRGESVPPVNNDFVTRWNMPAASFTLQLPSGYTYNFTVDWGDGSAQGTVTAYNDGDATHTYASAGVYDITISGTCPYFRPSNNTTTKNYLTDILNWGNVGVATMSYSYYTCINLVSIPGVPVPDSNYNINESFNGTFRGCTKLTAIPSDVFTHIAPAEVGVNFFVFCFRDCTSITGAVPDLWNTYPTASGIDCFRGDVNCSNYASIPTDWK